MRQLDSRITAERPLDIVVYQVMALKGEQFSTDDALLEAGLEIIETKKPQKAALGVWQLNLLTSPFAL